MALVRMIVRRADTFTTEGCDVAELFYDGNKKTLGIGDGSVTPPRLLTEDRPQTVSNKTIDGALNTLRNISPTSFQSPQYSVTPLQGVVSNAPITGTVQAVSPVMDQNAVNQLNANLAELKFKVNQIIQLLQHLNLSQ